MDQIGSYRRTVWNFLTGIVFSVDDSHKGIYEDERSVGEESDGRREKQNDIDSIIDRRELYSIIYDKSERPGDQETVNLSLDNEAHASEKLDVPVAKPIIKHVEEWIEVPGPTSIFKFVRERDGIFDKCVSQCAHDTQVFRVLCNSEFFIVKVLDRKNFSRQTAIISNLLLRTVECVPKVYSLISNNNCLFMLVQEYAAGKTLEMMLFDGEVANLSVHDKLQISIQLCRAVAYFHKHAVIHQDIQPRHVIINPENLNLKLVVSRATAEIFKASPFRGSGNPRYQSPQSLLGADEITFSEDIWSLGMVLAEVFTGHRPYYDHPNLFSPDDYRSFHQENLGIPRTAVVDYRQYEGQGSQIDHVGTLIHFATSMYIKFRPTAQAMHDRLKNIISLSGSCPRG